MMNAMGNTTVPQPGTKRLGVSGAARYSSVTSQSASANDPLQGLLSSLQSLRIDSEGERRRSTVRSVTSITQRTPVPAPVPPPQLVTSTRWSSTLNALSAQDLTTGDLRKAARATVRALAKNGLDNCCLVGSMACYFYGMEKRLPHDIDMLISTNALFPGAEQIKRLMVLTDPNFFLVPSTNPRATYKVLWYRIPSDDTSVASSSKKCKVDVLLSGSATDMRLPFVPKERVIWKVPPEYERKTSTSTSTLNSKLTKYPVIPLIPLLLLKLQAWHDHRWAYQQYKNDKVPQDVVDINEMLGIAVRRYEVNAKEEGWMERVFMERTESYVREYVGGKEKPDKERETWKGLGFSV